MLPQGDSNGDSEASPRCDQVCMYMRRLLLTLSTPNRHTPLRALPFSCCNIAQTSSNHIGSTFFEIPSLMFACVSSGLGT